MTDAPLPFGMLMQPYGAGRENLLRVRVSEREQADIHALRRALGLDNASDTVRAGLEMLKLASVEAPELVDSLLAQMRARATKE